MGPPPFLDSQVPLLSLPHSALLTACLCPPRCWPACSDVHSTWLEQPDYPCYSCSMLWPLSHSSSRDTIFLGGTPPARAVFQGSHPVLFCPPHRSKQSEGADKRPLNLPSSEQELSLPRWQELMKAGISRSWHLYTAKCWHLTKPLPFILCGLSTELPVAERKNPGLSWTLGCWEQLHRLFTA